MRSWFRVFPLLILLFAASAQAEDRVDVPDPNGAVLCVWSKYVQLRNFGTVCAFDGNSGLQPVLTESIARMDKFITDNSDITQSQLDDKKDQLLDDDKKKAAKSDKAELQKICAGLSIGGVSAAYKKLQDADPGHIRQEITKLLAIPRKPVMNPCM